MSSLEEAMLDREYPPDVIGGPTALDTVLPAAPSAPTSLSDHVHRPCPCGGLAGQPHETRVTSTRHAGSPQPSPVART